MQLTFPPESSLATALFRLFELGGCVQKAIGLICLFISLVASSAGYAQTVPGAPRLEKTPVATSASSNISIYRINPGDELEINVWREEQLQRIVKILPDGTFSFPLVGTIVAAGQTASQIEALITNALKQQYVDGNVPNVTVSVRSPAGLQFSVLGKVKSSGIFTPGRYVTLLEALSFAGGTDEFANLDNIAIIRKTPKGLVSIRARVGDILKNRSQADDIARNIPMIESGDTVIVP
jgi:polysaccharide biosynthesis/export protein